VVGSEQAVVVIESRRATEFAAVGGRPSLEGCRSGAVRADMENRDALAVRGVCQLAGAGGSDLANLAPPGNRRRTLAIRARIMITVVRARGPRSHVVSRQ
jgi:hypothetical protein